ncbi:MAG: Acetyltransferase (GNAT) family protein [bacterium ADurb.Bin374]|nr:MAG: Acetyltransferase (GNAT) family protein [bacterium ADurb.Bin374]
MVRPVKLEDIPAWLELAREVEPLFGPMAESEDFRSGIRQAILDGSAFCCETEGGTIGGIIALHREGNEIAWLAVSSACRGKGIGRLLMETAMRELDPTADILVQTFAAGLGSGTSARTLFTGFGFTDAGAAGKNPAGIDTVIMRRRPQNL